MATQHDIDALKQAIASGTRKVLYKNGEETREILYRDLSEMKEALALLERDLSGTPRSTPRSSAALYHRI